VSTTEQLITHASQATAGVGFCFLETGELVDRELELVLPEDRWIDQMLIGCRHPRTRDEEAEQAATTRQQLVELVRTAPGGREPADFLRGKVPCYHFWMRLREQYEPPLPMAGSISLRVGHNRDLELYFGHIGYGVYPPARGRHYAERACRLLFGLAGRHGLNPLWITTDPANLASRRTCERLGGVLVGVVDVPPDHMLYARGQKRKCRYRINL